MSGSTDSTFGSTSGCRVGQRRLLCPISLQIEHFISKMKDSIFGE